MNFNELVSSIDKWYQGEEEYLTLLLSGQYNSEGLLIRLIDLNLFISLYFLKVTKDISNCKNRLSQAALIKLYLHEKFDNNNYTSSNLYLVSSGFSYCCLSDNENLKNKYLLYQDNFLKNYGAHYARTMQACMRPNDEEFQKQISILEKFTLKDRIAKKYSGVAVAFRGILIGDKDLIEKGITEILAKHSKQEHTAIIRDFMNIEALVLAKLAFSRGIQVELVNELLPMELVPVNPPLNYFKYYKFLNDIEFS